MLDVTSALNGAHVLVVEDEFIILMELQSVLTEAGAVVIGGCRSIDEALSLVDDEDLEVAILDIRLGKDTVAPVARELTRRGIPFIFYTGQVETDPIRAEWPDCKIVPKPARPQMIVAALAALLRRDDTIQDRAAPVASRT